MFKRRLSIAVFLGLAEAVSGVADAIEERTHLLRSA
jgi:hypothetical protein